MRRTLLSLTLFSIVCSLVFPLAGESAPDPVGTWVGDLRLNDGGATKVTLVLKREGPGLRGTLSDEAGLFPAETKLESPSILGNELKFSCVANDNTGTVTVKFTMKIEGNRMTGRWEDEQNGTGNAVELSRKS